MIAAMAMAAGAVFADTEIASANIVGYINKGITFDDPDLGQGFKFFTPTFRAIADGSMNVQDIQLGADANSYDANLQRLDFEAGSACYYTWLTKTDALLDETVYLPVGFDWSGKNGVWLTDKLDDQGEWIGMMPPEGDEAIVQPGETFQIDCLAGREVNFAGQVSDANITYELDFTTEDVAQGFRFVGNGFAASISVQDVQLCADANSYDANFQRLDFEAGSACYYTWMTKADAELDETVVIPDGFNWEGKNGVWLTDLLNDQGEWIGMTIPQGEDDTVEPGDGFQIDCLSGRSLTILAPYDL